MIFIARSQSATAPAKSINLRVVRSGINILLHKDRKSKSAMTIAIEGIAKLNQQTWYYEAMNTYNRHRFPSDVISYAVWLYYRFTLSAIEISKTSYSSGVSPSVASRSVCGVSNSVLYTPED